MPWNAIMTTASAKKANLADANELCNQRKSVDQHDRCLL